MVVVGEGGEGEIELVLGDGEVDVADGYSTWTDREGQSCYDLIRVWWSELSCLQKEEEVQCRCVWIGR